MGEFYLKILKELKRLKKKMTKKPLILLIVNFAIIDKRLIDNIIYALLRVERICLQIFAQLLLRSIAMLYCKCVS